LFVRLIAIKYCETELETSSILNLFKGGVSSAVPVDAHQPPGEQVAQLERRGQARHHGGSVGTGGGQEEAQRLHQLPDQTPVSADDDQRPTAQEAEHGVLGERVLFEEPERSESRLPPPPMTAGEGEPVRGAGDAGAVGALVHAQPPERSAGRRPAVRLGAGGRGAGRRHGPMRRRLH